MKVYRVKLTPEERAHLLQLLSKGKAAARTLTHARMGRLEEYGKSSNAGWKRGSRPLPERKVAESAETSGRSTQTTAKAMNERDDFSNADVERWTPHQVAGTGRAAAPHVAHRFKAFQEALSGLGSLQSTAVTQSIAHGHMTALDHFGRLAAYPVQPGPSVLRARAGGRYRLDIRLVVVGDHLVRDHPAALDGLAKERLGTGRVAVIT